MQKQTIIILLSLICIVNGNYAKNGNYRPNNNYGNYDTNQYSSCEPYENNIYQVTVTFPGMRSLYAVLRLLPDGAFDELFSISNGNNAEEVGANFALSSRVGRYECFSKNYMRLTGLGYLFRTPEVEFLKVNGAVVIHDYYFKFTNNYQNCAGTVKFAVFKSGTNPFTTRDQPVKQGDIGKVSCELLKFRRYFNLPISVS